MYVTYIHINIYIYCIYTHINVYAQDISRLNMNMKHHCLVSLSLGGDWGCHVSPRCLSSRTSVVRSAPSPMRWVPVAPVAPGDGKRWGKHSCQLTTFMMVGCRLMAFMIIYRKTTGRLPIRMEHFDGERFSTPKVNLRQLAEATSKAWLQTGNHVAATCSPSVRHGHSVIDDWIQMLQCHSVHSVRVARLTYICPNELLPWSQRKTMS